MEEPKTVATKELEQSSGNKLFKTNRENRPSIASPDDFAPEILISLIQQLTAKMGHHLIEDAQSFMKMNAAERKTALEKFKEAEEAAKSAENNIETLADLQNFSGGRLAVFDDDMYQKFKNLKLFLMKKYYRAPSVLKVTKKGQKMITKIFEILDQNPKLIINFDISQEKYQQIVDFIAGMTDNFAEDFYLKNI